MKDRESITTNGRAVFYAAILDDLRQAAMNKGWALALHGSLASDMDIMAMAWTKEATTDKEMIEALKNCFTDAECIDVLISDMPNNRRVFTLAIWADFYLDINVIKTNISDEFICRFSHKITTELWGSTHLESFGNLEIKMQQIINELLHDFEKIKVG